MKLVFMGTPDFAVPCLTALQEAGHEIAAVFTQPDKPKGRGYALTPPPVKEKALSYGLPVYQPATVRDGEAEALLREIGPDAVAVVAYGKILPPALLEIPRYGCINVHASLLPRHRGASPIQWAIVCGDEKTGVTTMQMAEGMDTGDILEQVETPIDPDETAESLHDRLSHMGAKLLVQTLQDLEAGTVTPIKQDEALATKAPLIRKEMGQMDFAKTAGELHNLARGFYPWPGAYTTLGGKRLKVLETRLAAGDGAPGEVLCAEGRLTVACGGHTALELVRVQLEGKKPLTAADLLRGHPIPAGTRLGE
ncbi:MAG TPA: methionyl-tRNA formyltransferase [Firmicutes bacterium]|nr:methionyl-tRNA formyltransferase [Bacillota bacterium]